MHFEAQTMARAVAEGPRQTMGRKHPPCGAIDIDGERARLYLSDSRCLRFSHRVEETAKRTRFRPDVQRPAQVHAVSVVDASEVQQDTLSFARARAVGRACGSALFGPEATMVSNAGRSNPARFIASSTSVAT